jgi:hypothetical protein
MCDTAVKYYIILSNCLTAFSGITNVIVGGYDYRGFQLAWIFGGISILISTLNILQDKLGFAQNGSTHKRLANSWAVLISKIEEVIVPVRIEKLDNTVATLGADQLYLLSHKTTIPGKDQIVLDNSIYGITGETFNDIIEPNTSSMVRGEELFELLQLIVNFLITHDHPYPMLPPSPISRGSGISTDDVLKKMQEAYIRVLNSNIRIN